MARRKSSRDRSDKRSVRKPSRPSEPPESEISEMAKHHVMKRLDLDDPSLARQFYGSQWRSMLKSERRARFRKKRDSKIKVESESGVIKEVLRISLLAKGSVHIRYVTCGKNRCKCMKDRDKRHGPYYYLSLPIPKAMGGGKGDPMVKHFYITQQEAMEFDKKIRNFKEMQRQIWVDIVEEFEGAGLDF